MLIFYLFFNGKKSPSASMDGGICTNLIKLVFSDWVSLHTKRIDEVEPIGNNIISFRFFIDVHDLKIMIHDFLLKLLINCVVLIKLLSILSPSLFLSFFISFSLYFLIQEKKIDSENLCANKYLLLYRMEAWNEPEKKLLTNPVKWKRNNLTESHFNIN